MRRNNNTMSNLNNTSMRTNLTLVACLAAAAGLLYGATAQAAGTPPDGSPGISRNALPQKAVAATLPYFNDFNEESSVEGWTFVNTNRFFTWAWADNYGGVDSTPCLYMSQRPAEGWETASDNWAISPAFRLEKGFTYRVRFYIKNWFPADVDVRLMTGTDISEPGTLLINYSGQEWGYKEMEFEVSSTGDYRLAFWDHSPWTFNDTALRCQVMVDNLSLEALSNNAVPEPAAELTQVPGANGQVSMGLTWINPSLSKQGEDLDALSSVQIFRDGVLAETIRDGVTPGARMSWTDSKPTPGIHVYKVIVANTTGESDPAQVNTFIGIDDPGAPQEVNVDYDPDGGVVTLDWEGPAFGRRGGWFDKTGMSYRVVRQPGNKMLANNLTDPYFEDTDLSEYGNYIYEVTARTSTALGGTTRTNGVIIGETAPLPVVEDWENPDTYPLWEISDNNGDGHTIFIKHAWGHGNGSCIGWNYRTTQVDVDESLYSMPVRLEKGKKYRGSVWVKSGPSCGFGADLTYGKSKTKASQSGVIFSYSDVTTNGAWDSMEADFSVSETGVYYICLRVHDITQFDLWFDDIRIEEVFDKNLEASAVRNLDPAPTAGDRITTGVTYTNRGTARSTAFKVQLVDDDENVLGEQNVSRALNSGATGTANIEWTVPEAVGRFGIRGRVVMNGDKCAADNSSKTVYLDIQDRNHRAVTIGTSDDTSDKLAFGRGYHMSEFIYHGEDFGDIAGDITGMTFRVQFGMDADFDRLPFTIYVGKTNEDDLFKGWHSSYSLTKVFDGDISLTRGMTEVYVPFDKAFSYGGGNLVVRVVGNYDPSIMVASGYGIFNYVTEVGLGASRLWTDSSKPDLQNLNQSTGSYYSYRPNVTFFIDHSNAVRISGTVRDNEGNAVEGVLVNGGSSYPTLQGMTDAEGRYEIPYFPVGYGSAQLQASKKGYVQANLYGQLKAGESAVIDCGNLEKCPVITIKGTVCSATDNTTPIAGARITGRGDTSFEAVTDAEGNFSVEGVYGMKRYDVFTVEADGYKPLDWSGTQFYGNDGEEYTVSSLNLTPITAAPASVTALDRGDKAEITWEDPVEDVTVSKCGSEIAGVFSGPAVTTVAHRYSPEELKQLGVGEDLVVKALRFLPNSYSRFSLCIWQGPEGNEAPVYYEDVTASGYKQWNEFELSRPYKVDPTQSLLIGFKVRLSTGSYPICFDNGPAREGGDVIFDPQANQWTTARDILPGQMDYNWAIQAVFGASPNSAPVAWAQTETKSPARAVSLNDASLDDLATLAAMKDRQEEESAVPSAASIQFFKSPIHAPSEGGKLKHQPVGYNIFRLEPGQEKSYMGLWTKVNEEPVTGNSFIDEKWAGAEQKPYRYAVVSHYGNPYAWGLGVNSDATFSDGVDKGHYATVTVNLSTDNGDAEDAKVYLNGDGKSLVKTVAKGESTVSFDDIRFADYAVKVIKPYFDLYSSELRVEAKETVHDAILRFSAPEPTGLSAVDYVKDVRLGWTAPTSAVGATYMHCSPNPGQALNYNQGKETIIGHRITAQAREGFNYTDFYIDEIGFYANAACTVCPVVWRHNILADKPIWEQQELEESHEVYRQTYKVSPAEVGTWVTVKLDEPVKLNATDTYYYGIAATTTNQDLPLILDEGTLDDEGMWYYAQSQTTGCYEWMRPSMGACWMIKAHLTDTPDASAAETKPVKYDLFRMAAADRENENAWTKVTSATDKAEFIDATWKNLADADYLYAVKAIYDGNSTSKAVFSKELQKGKVALVNAQLTCNNGLSAAGAAVTVTSGQKSFHAEADAKGHVEIPEVPNNRAFDFIVSLPAYEEINERVKISSNEMNLNYELKEILEMPLYLDAAASADNQEVNLTWREPGQYAPAEGWAYWDNGTPYGGYGTSTGFCAAAQAFTPEDLEAKRMKELDITKISIFPTSSKSNPVSPSSYWTAKIWSIDMNTGMATEVATGDGKDIKLDSWNEIEFDEPYHINGDESLLIGYEFHGAGNALGIDAGPCVNGRGDWANFGQGWTVLSATQSNFNYNNLIHVYVENLGRKTGNKAASGGEKTPILKDAKASGLSISRVAANAKAPEHPQLTFGVRYPVKGYRVYRLPVGSRQNESEWTLLTETPVSATEFRDTNWKNVADGCYFWAVKAVYATGDSEPEISLTALNEDGSPADLSDVEVLDSDNIGITRIGDSKILVTVPSEAVLSVADTAGLNILSQTLSAGRNIVEIDTADGIALIRIDMNGISRSRKLMLK